MASRDTSTTIPHSPDIDTFPNPQLARSEAGEVASILSSRMTDIASEDGEELQVDPASRAAQQGQRRSIQTTTSRPNTAVTGVSSQRGAWSQAPPSRRGYVSPNGTQRGSTLGSVPGSAGGRPQSATSRTHVPSLTSRAFFRPMSSQRLQAQRGGSRPPTMTQEGKNEDGPAEGESTVPRNSVGSNRAAKQGANAQDDTEGQSPPSRGTEMTEQETWRESLPTQALPMVIILLEALRKVYDHFNGMLSIRKDSVSILIKVIRMEVGSPRLRSLPGHFVLVSCCPPEERPLRTARKEAEAHRGERSYLQPRHHLV
jgi:hypothetical protein